MKSQSSSLPKKGGVTWWLLWIVIAMGSFICSAVVWTWLLETFFGNIQGSVLTLLWVGAVFGSWLLTMIPVIRAKERYWNRLTSQDETSVTWWIGWMGLTIASFFVSTGFWTWWFARTGVSLRESGATAHWVFAVFGTWMLALLPLMVSMYRRVDRAYEKARLAREAKEAEPHLRKTVYVEPGRRNLRDPLISKLKQYPPTIKKGRQSGHLVHATLKDGRRFENIFVANRREILGIYGCENLPFDAEDIADLDLVPRESLPRFDESGWLRLDGR